MEKEYAFFTWTNNDCVFTSVWHVVNEANANMTLEEKWNFKFFMRAFTTSHQTFHLYELNIMSKDLECEKGCNFSFQAYGVREDSSF